MNKILVTGYHNIDLDGAACAYAYAELLNKLGTSAEFGVSGSTEAEPTFVFKKLKIKVPDADKIISPDTKMIICDASEPRWLSKKINPEKVIEVIDHRKVHCAHEFKNAKIQVELVGACATLICEKFIKAKIKPIKESATLLYLAIVSNAINFKNKVTTNRDKVAAEYLKKLAEISDDLIWEMFAHKSRIDKPIKDILALDLSHNIFSGKKICILQLEIVGVDAMVKANLKDILDALREFEKTNNYDHIFLTCVDIEKGNNTFVCANPETQKLISKVLNVKFKNGTAHYPEIIMRKEIMPKIKEYLER